MNYWSIKEIADMMGITIQAIYKYKDKYIEMGYMEKDSDGKYVVNLNGYNYFLSKKNGVDTPGNITPGNNDNMQNDYIELLKKRVEQLEQELQEQKKFYTHELDQEKDRTAYFMRLFEQKEQQLNQYMLPPGNNDKKRSLWSKIFGN